MEALNNIDIFPTHADEWPGFVFAVFELPLLVRRYFNAQRIGNAIAKRFRRVEDKELHDGLIVRLWTRSLDSHQGQPGDTLYNATTAQR